MITNFAGFDRVHQCACHRQPFDRQPLRQRRGAPIGPLLAQRDASPPLDLAHEVQTSALLEREQHRKALPLQRMERVSDHQ